jgi:DNA-binding response OmpR family regulator
MSKIKVAIIEDDPSISSMYSMKLNSTGYDVKTAENGEEGLALIESFKPDVILLDLMMPVMDGLQVLESLKKKPIQGKAKLIVLSNMGDSETSAKIAGFSVDDRIIKADYTPSQVEARIQKVLSN